MMFKECKAYIESPHGEKSVPCVCGGGGFDHIMLQEYKAYIGSQHGEK